MCGRCPLRSSCVPPSAEYRSVKVVNGYPSLLRARRSKERGWDSERKAHYRAHRSCIEGRHGEAKSRHQMGRALFRGLRKVRGQVVLTMAVLNLKILAQAARSAGVVGGALLLGCCWACGRLLGRLGARGSGWRIGTAVAAA